MKITWADENDKIHMNYFIAVNSLLMLCGNDFVIALKPF